jgi:pyridoxamine 5'-phosphate oxidase
MVNNYRNLRKNYSVDCLNDSQVPNDPFELFKKWFNEVTNAGGVEEVNAMTLSTINAKGILKGRIVLLKELSDNGFIFYTNYNSNKSKAIKVNPNVSLSFFWPNLERQVIISGFVKKIAASISDSYFNSRPRGSQLGAHVSNQSQPLESRNVLEKRKVDLEKQFYNKEIPRPFHWGGFVVSPKEIEFWQGRPNRLHDRICYYKQDNLWINKRLSP